MDRESIAMAIAEELLDNGALDENNFSHDVGALLGCVQEIILKHLEGYALLSGSIL